MKISLIGMGSVGSTLAYTLLLRGLGEELVLVDGFLGVDDLCLSLPVVLGKDGIVQVLEPEFGEEEVAAFHRCAETVRRGMEESLG
jgi:malate/lactate dehydrogenase